MAAKDSFHLLVVNYSASAYTNYPLSVWQRNLKRFTGLDALCPLRYRQIRARSGYSNEFATKLTALRIPTTNY